MRASGRVSYLMFARKAFVQNSLKGELPLGVVTTSSSQSRSSNPSRCWRASCCDYLVREASANVDRNRPD
jgi:hypothetical protein